MQTDNLPPQPAESEWQFIQQLQAPLWTRHAWAPRAPRQDEVSLANGVRLVRGFPDPEHLLDTAYEDVGTFLAAGGVPLDGDTVIETKQAQTDVHEAYRIEVADGTCRVLAADTEGIRRGLFFVEDQMLRAGGPFLTRGTTARRPFVRSRISRCFFGPIKRPPKLRDELTDDVDYYPDQYLNRLAHEAVNGLWLTVEFRDLCRTSIVPEYGADAERRLAKLRRTVETCRRYGIKIYVFCIEPRAWDNDDPVLTRYPELGRGGATYGDRSLFCPFSDAAQTYLSEAVNSIFTNVPNLGGLINITHGERATTCLSAMAATSSTGVKCPVCSEKEPWEILHASLSAMERGMHAAAPDAELISWLYMPQSEPIADWVYDIPAHTPDNVILQFNFESGVEKEMLGKVRVGGDYWLSAPGPSHRFDKVARVAREHGTAMSAKIQTGCSHEVASVPFVPIPGQLHKKFRAMHELGVSHVMLCWYFGNYPGLMNKAAGELSFEPFVDDENAFLLELARIDWRAHAEQVAQAWNYFTRGYENYPLTNLFQYYGPMHDGPVWPLLLEPEDAPLSPTWLLGSTITRKPYPPSGDRIGEAFAYDFTLEEVVELSRRMADSWEQGVSILERIAAEYAEQPERMLDIGVARALGIQFRSGSNILRFYQLREQMLRSAPAECVSLFSEIAEIVCREIAADEQLLKLCEHDSRLGFHSEAEGYKYFPAKIRWRMEQLQELLAETLPEAEAAAVHGEQLSHGFIGRDIQGEHAVCTRLAETCAVWPVPPDELPAQLDLHTCGKSGSGEENWATRWAFCHDSEALYLLARCTRPQAPPAPTPQPATELPLAQLHAHEAVVLKLEPRRLWPCKRLAATATGGKLADEDYEVRTKQLQNGWTGVMRMPFAALGLDPENLTPIRVDVQRTIPAHVSGAAAMTQYWQAQHPWTPRLRLGADNPADLGWLVFGTPTLSSDDS